MSIFDELAAGIVTRSADETVACAARFGEALPPDTVVALEGAMGLGKTTFVSGLGRAWNIPGPVTSPTYNLYLIHRGSRQLIHFDAYRINGAAQAEDLAIEELLTSPWCLAIEWPENTGNWLPDETLRIRFQPGPDPESRHLQLER